MPDVSKYCVSTARTQALLKADVVLVLGARLNWMLHFGQPPRYAPDVKIIQVSTISCVDDRTTSFARL